MTDRQLSPEALPENLVGTKFSGRPRGRLQSVDREEKGLGTCERALLGPLAGQRPVGDSVG